jgi:hypothetical protein
LNAAFGGVAMRKTSPVATATTQSVIVIPIWRFPSVQHARDW